MGKKINLSFLILCSILSQGIGISSDQTIEESLNLHIRKKRLIDRTLNGNRPVKIQYIPYIVSLQKNGNHTCGAAILTPIVIITAAHCVADYAVYTILSGSAKRNTGLQHHVIHIERHPYLNLLLFIHDIALLVVLPPIDLVHSVNRPITLYDEYPHPSTPAIFSGWGCIFKTEDDRLIFPQELRSITVSIINLQECHNTLFQKLHNNIVIGDKDICTGEENGEKGSCNGDSGGPLAVNGKLAGILSYNSNRALFASRENPDIFVNLVHPTHKYWIIFYVDHFTRLFHG